MKALAYAMSSTPAPTLDEGEDFEDGAGGDDVRFHNACLEEIDRYRRIDEWIPSYQNIVSRSALDCKRMLVKAGTIKLNTLDFLQYTSDGTSDLLRLSAFDNMMDLGLAKNPAILRWFLFVLGTDPSPSMREQMLHMFGKTLGSIAIGEASEPTANAIPSDGLIVETEASTENRKADIARKQTVVGALQALKDEVGNDTVLQAGLWIAITSPKISLQQMWQLLEICDRLYIPQTSIVVALKLPRYWKCTKVGKGKVLFSRTERVRTTPLPKRAIKLKINAGGSGGGGLSDQQPLIKRDTSSSGGGVMSTSQSQRTLLKPPKPPMQRLSSVSSMESGLESPSQGEGGQKKLKLKLKLSSGGGGGGGGAGSPPR